MTREAMHFALTRLKIVVEPSGATGLATLLSGRIRRPPRRIGVIVLGGNSIPIYEMGFDVFAGEHGFNSAVIQSMDGGPNRFVYLRR